MKFSIIIPAYNAEKTIKKCIDSILSQSYQNYEIIVINDGSSDDTLDILESYDDERIKIINQKNSGVSFSRNVGLKKATGDYINFIDADDYIQKGLLMDVVKVLEMQKVDILRYNFVFDKDDYKGHKNELFLLKNKRINIKDKKEYIYERFFTKFDSIPTFSPLLFIKNSLAVNVEFDKDLCYLEDADFYLSLFEKAKNIYFLDDKKYIITTPETSASRNISKKAKNIKSILKLNEKWSNKYLFSQNLYKKICTTHAYAIGLMLPDLYDYDRKDFKNKLNQFYVNDSFKNIFNNMDSSMLSKKDKILLKLLKKNRKIFLIILIKLILIYRKIKKRGV